VWQQAILLIFIFIILPTVLRHYSPATNERWEVGMKMRRMAGIPPAPLGS
jgi:hypothetical protein